MTPLDCLTGHGKGSSEAVWWLFFQNGLTVFLYIWIAGRFIKLFGYNIVALLLMMIFMACACLGYLTFNIAFWLPDAAYSGKLIFQTAHNIACIAFITETYRKRFLVISKHESLGHQLTDLALKQKRKPEEILESIKAMREAGKG